MLVMRISNVSLARHGPADWAVGDSDTVFVLLYLALNSILFYKILDVITYPYHNVS